MASSALDRLITAGLGRQADRSATFDDAWTAFFESPRVRGHGETWRRYFREGLRPTMRTRRTVHIGGSFAMSVTIEPRVSTAVAKRVTCRLLRMTIGPIASAVPLRYDPRTADRFGRHMDGDAFVIPVSLRDDAEWRSLVPGEYEATVDVLMTTDHPTNDWIETLRAPVTVKPALPTQVTPDLATDVAVARSLRVTASPDPAAPADGLTFNGSRVLLAVTCDGAPVDLYAQVGVSIGTGSHVGGHMYWAKGDRGTRYVTLPGDAFAGRAGLPHQITLYGSPHNAQQTFAEGDFWHGGVHIQNVTLLDVKSAPTTRPAEPVVKVYSKTKRAPDRSYLHALSDLK